MKLTPLFLVTAVALSWGTPLATAAEYQLIAAEGKTWWNETSASVWNGGNPWDGVPSAGGPGAGDRLDLAGNGEFTLMSSPAPVDDVIVRQLARLTVSGESGLASLVGWSNRATVLEISGNIEANESRGLRLWNANSSGVLKVDVGGNVTVGSESTLWLGNINSSGAGQSANDRLSEFSVAGSTIISGTLLNSGGNNTLGSNSNAFGDLVVHTGGNVIGAAGGDGSTNTGVRTYHLNARSLSGGGTVSASSMTQIGTREVHLNLDTVTIADTTFSGVLQDSSVATSGTNRLHLTVSGPGRQTLSGANTYTGQTRVKSGGTLLVDGTHTQAVNGVGGGAAADGLYHVETTATLGGSGEIAGRSSANNTNLVYVASGGTLAPGTGSLVLDGGNLTGAGSRHLNLAAGAALSFTVAGDGGGAGHLELWNYAGAGDLLLNNNVIHLTLSGPVVAGTYTVSLVSFFSDGGTAAAQSGLTGGLTLSGAVLDPGIVDAQLLFNDTDIALQYTVVPEPAAGLLGLFGLGVWACVRRARSAKDRAGLG